MRFIDSFRYRLNDAEAKFSREIALYSAPNSLKYIAVHSDVEVNNAQREWAIDLLIISILKHVSVSSDPRSIQTLELLFNDFNASYPVTSLELDEIIREGYVRLVWDQWHIPRSFSFSRQIITEEASDLKQFLNLLNSTPYSDARTLIVTCTEGLIESHRLRYTATPEIQWFIDNQVFKQEEEQIVLNVESPFLKTFAARALASLWEDLTVGPIDRDERLSWWIERFELLREGFDFLEWVSPLAREEFLDECVARLLAEEDCLSWDAEIRKIIAEWAAADVDRDQSLLNDRLELPYETLIGQVIWWDKTNLEAAQFVHEARERLSCLFGWVMRWEKKEFPFRTSSRFEQLIDSLISRPFFTYELMLECQRFTPRLIPYFLLRPATLATGTVLLAMFEPDFQGANYSIETKLEREEISRKLWQEAQLFISYTLTHMTEEGAAEAILQITSWLQQKIRTLSVYSNYSEKLERHREQLEILLETLNGNQIFNNEDHLSKLANALLMLIENVLKCNKVPIESDPWRLLLWMAERIGQQRIFPDNSDLIRKCVSIIINGYTSSLCLLEKSYRNDELVQDIFSPGWVYIFRWTHVSNTHQWMKLLNPYDFEAEINKITSEDNHELKGDLQKALILKIRVHIGLLAGLIMEWSKSYREQLPKELIQLFAQYFLNYQTDDNAISVDAFDFSGVSIHGSKDTKKTALMKSIAEAINCLPDDIRIDTLTQFGIKSPDVYRMVSLLKYLQRNSDKKIIEKALMDRGTQGLEKVVWLNNAQEIISELIDSREPQLVELARAYLERFGNVGIKRRLHGWVEWFFAQQLRISLIMCEYDSILDAVIPEETVEKEYLRTVLDFYKGLANLEKGGPEISYATAIFKRITQAEPLNLGNAVNLLACYVRQVEFDIKQEKIDQVEYLTKKAEELAEVILSDPNKEKVTQVEEVLAANILYLTILNKNWRGFWTYYERFSLQTRLSSKCGVYAVQVCINQERWEEAQRLLTELQHWHGLNEELENLKLEIGAQHHLNKTYGRPGLVVDLNQWQFVTLGFNNLKSLPPADQVRVVLNSDSASVQLFLVREVLDLCRLVQEYIPNLTISDTPAEEDRYTDLFKMFFNQRLAYLGWSIDTQAKGGFTGRPRSSNRGGVGERDIVIYDGHHNILGLGEALILQNVDRSKILEHVEKVFGYDTVGANFYFLLTWGYTDRPQVVWQGYRALVEEEFNEHFAYIASSETQEIFTGVNENGLSSFVTSHKAERDDEEALVCHIFVDVKRNSRWEIAREARES